MSSLTSGRPRTEPSAVVLAVAGSATVATAFGMARYGYGLLLPDIQHALALGAAAMGAVGTLAYVSYLVAAALVSRCVARAGERITVVAGGGLAVAGTIAVALAKGPVPLGLGVAIAGASAGLVYPPFAEAIKQLPDTTRDERWRRSTAAPAGESPSPLRSRSSRVAPGAPRTSVSRDAPP